MWTHLSVVIILLVIEVRLESQFGSADPALQTSPMEEREVFQRPQFIDLIYGLSTSQTEVLV